ncbi:vasorin b [Electrophorus electricus]|uniref:EGF-like domain-containing protein n=1 Tax=Electrophorus electricus TaxID=8005 RepID=A0A4W4H6E9_ELEEL|nr:vasorin b [Electrophorus electricus]
MKPLLLSLLVCILLPPFALASFCPKDCACTSPDSIICFQRRAATMPSGVPPLTKNLYVFQNGIESLHRDEFIGLENLELLDLSQNKITQLPNHVFETLTSLRNLDLSSNQINHISQDSFAGLELLERLYLYNNAITSIHPAAFDGLEQLLELKLQGNKLTMLPPLKMPRLLLLDLRLNMIPSPGPTDLQTPKLESLKLGGLGIKNLNEELLGSFKNLHELDISNNQLNAFPPILREARGLVILSMAGNPMGPLRWEDFGYLAELQELDISNLSLQSLPESMTQLFPNLKRLTVAENPFNCLCTMAWFPSWLWDQQIQLGRTEETRCHFPPRNAGEVLERLKHRDFGCPTTTTITTSTLKTTTQAPALITTVHSTTHATPLLKPSDDPLMEAGSDLPPLVPASPSSITDLDVRFSLCLSNICLNGGTCWVDRQGHHECTCPRGTSGKYCQNEDDPPPSEDVTTATVTMEPEIIAQIVKSSSILLDLHRYIEMRPYIRGVRLTYRNLSGADKRPKQLNIPASYPEYTLRGLQPNSTYSVCASPLGEPSDVDSMCTEVRTSSQQAATARMEDRQLTTTLVPAVAILLLLVLVAVAVGVACYMHRKRTHLELECNHSQLELEGVKAGLDNGTLPQKQSESLFTPSVVQNGALDYEVQLMQEHNTANNNTNSLKPSYF